MGYDLKAKNPEAGEFHMGAFSFPVIISVCQYLWPMAHENGQWYCVFGADERMPEGDKYPRIISNDGFKVTAEESKIMALLVRNFCKVQRTLPDENQPDDMRGKASFTKEDLLILMQKAMTGAAPGPWPVKIRPDFVDRLEEFVTWAEKSQGFEIW